MNSKDVDKKLTVLAEMLFFTIFSTLFHKSINIRNFKSKTKPSQNFFDILLILKKPF